MGMLIPCARIEESASGAAGTSQPAAEYAGNSTEIVRSSRCLLQIASQVTSPRTGTMNAA